jgi:hypothetical protein
VRLPKPEETVVAIAEGNWNINLKLSESSRVYVIEIGVWPAGARR